MSATQFEDFKFNADGSIDRSDPNQYLKAVLWQTKEKFVEIEIGKLMQRDLEKCYLENGNFFLI